MQRCQPWNILASVVSVKKVPRSQKLNIVFRQCRSLVGRPELQQFLINLVAEKEEVDVAEVITKALKKGMTPTLSSRDLQAFQPWQSSGARPSPYPNRGRRKASSFRNLLQVWSPESFCARLSQSQGVKISGYLTDASVLPSGHSLVACYGAVGNL